MRSVAEIYEGVQEPKADSRDGKEAPSWLQRKAFQLRDDGRLPFTMYLATVDSAMSMPSLSSSPWMRGAPQSTLATLLSRISRRISAGILGRPPRERDFQR